MPKYDKTLRIKKITWNVNTFSLGNIYNTIRLGEGFPGGTVGKNLLANARDEGNMGLIFESGISPGGGNSNPLRYSCLDNPTDRGVWWATVPLGSQRVGHKSVTEHIHRLGELGLV